MDGGQVENDNRRDLAAWGEVSLSIIAIDEETVIKLMPIIQNLAEANGLFFRKHSSAYLKPEDAYGLTGVKP